MTVTADWSVLLFSREQEVPTAAESRDFLEFILESARQVGYTECVVRKRNHKMKVNTMIYFNCDYNEGAHPRILEKLMETNLEQTIGYGEDEYCAKAREAIREACHMPEAEVHFLVGGTQTNAVVIKSLLRPHQAVLCVDSGHINVHESGAIEATGHKVMALKGENGKLTAAQVQEAYDLHWNDGTHEHMTQPKMVYISHPTEYGTLYTKTELEELRAVCRRCNLYLFLDGARMGYGLCAEKTDVDLETIAMNTDVFYIGGTKVGALFGEAVVFSNTAITEDFRYLIKQNGGMLAKGRLLGLQFLELFRDGLYFEISRHAIAMAELLKEGFREAGYEFFYESPTNQQFVIMEDDKWKMLTERYGFEYISRYDETRSVIRFCTSWATKEENVRQLIADVKAL